MRSRPDLVGGTLRAAAAAASLAAVAIVLRDAHAVRSGQVTLPAREGGVATAASLKAPRSWALRAGGWYIRVDGAEISIPSLADQTAAPPHASLGVSISPFDRLIVHHAKAEGFDWRLIAALIFEESRFNPASRSNKGAVGLMQVRPIAAEAVGAEHFKAPDDNVKTGVRYLRQLHEMFSDARGRDRLALVLAAYNMGPGHVRDAQTLARRYGYDPNRWEDGVDLMLPLLEQPSIYKDLPNGFAQGTATVRYVKRILDRYEQYKHATADANTDAVSSSEVPAAHG